MLVHHFQVPQQSESGIQSFVVGVLAQAAPACALQLIGELNVRELQELGVHARVGNTKMICSPLLAGALQELNRRVEHLVYLLIALCDALVEQDRERQLVFLTHFLNILEKGLVVCIFEDGFRERQSIQQPALRYGLFSLGVDLLKSFELHDGRFKVV